MKNFILACSGLLISVCFCSCGQMDRQLEIYASADSLLRLTQDLQAKIGSAEIQRLQHFEEEINRDLAALDSIRETDRSLVQYLELQDGLGQCMKACSQFHEETFLLESSLRDIMEKSRLKNADLEELKSRFRFELENYRDLSNRIDSSIRVATRQAEIYHSLKPEINRIKEGVDSIPNPLP